MFCCWTMRWVSLILFYNCLFVILDCCKSYFYFLRSVTYLLTLCYKLSFYIFNKSYFLFALLLNSVTSLLLCYSSSLTFLYSNAMSSNCLFLSFNSLFFSFSIRSISILSLPFDISYIYDRTQFTFFENYSYFYFLISLIFWSTCCWV